MGFADENINMNAFTIHNIKFCPMRAEKEGYVMLQRLKNMIHKLNVQNNDMLMMLQGTFNPKPETLQP